MGVVRARDTAGQAVPSTASEVAWTASFLIVLGPFFLLLSGCSARSSMDEAYPALADFDGRIVERVVFVGPEPIGADSLRRVIETEPSHCSLAGMPICLPFGLGEQIHTVDAAMVQDDAQRLELLYDRSGYFGTDVVAAIEPAGEDAAAVYFVITRGDSVILDTLSLTGLDSIVDAEEVRERLPIHSGDLFDLMDFSAAADTVQRVLLNRGYARAQVLRNFSVDTVSNSAVAGLTAVSGPEVTIDSIIVEGAQTLSRRTISRQLFVERGDLLRYRDLIESQRNLYSLDLIQFATVEVAADSLQLSPDDPSRTTVLVQVVEGPVHVIEALVGYGSVDCVRSRLRWVSRSFAGGARRLAVTGSVSKIGIGKPLRTGFGDTFCRAYRRDPFANLLDYRVATDLTQPWFLSPRNHLTLSMYAERESEPSVFRREARGTRLSVARRLDPYAFATLSVDAERASVEAAPAVFCAAFQVCLPTDIRELGRSRWTNTLEAGWVRERTDSPVDPRTGYVVRASTGWATRILGSDIEFVRTVADGSRYIDLRRDRVLALRARFGSLTRATTRRSQTHFLPPDERFYAGGANTVRGFRRNELGPVIYVGDGPVFEDAEVRSIATGGTTVGILNAEYRAPSPFLRSLLRLAVFVDAGTVSTEGDWPFEGSWRVTPGFGFRAETPVGPVRIDIGYNPYAPTRGPLYLTETETGALIRVDDRYAPSRGSFLERFRLHLAIGQPF